MREFAEQTTVGVSPCQVQASVEAFRARPAKRACRVQGAAAEVALAQAFAAAEVWVEDAVPEVLAARASAAGVGQEEEPDALALAVGAAQEPDVQVPVADASAAAPELDVAAGVRAVGEWAVAPSRAAGEPAVAPALGLAVETRFLGALPVGPAQDAAFVPTANAVAIPADSQERFALEVLDVKVVASGQGFLVGLAFAQPLPAYRAVEVEELPLIAAAASEREPGVEHCDLPVKAGSRPQLQGVHCSQLQSWHDSLWRFVQSAFEPSSAVCAARGARRSPLDAAAPGCHLDHCSWLG